MNSTSQLTSRTPSISIVLAAYNKGVALRYTLPSLTSFCRETLPGEEGL